MITFTFPANWPESVVLFSFHFFPIKRVYLCGELED